MSKASSTEEYLIKIIIVGDSAVGKTKLLGRFSDSVFNTNYVSTIGVDFKVKTITID
jgi:GTPase SAR1 family protein